MTPTLRFALAQLNFLVGDVQGNATRVITTARRAQSELAADLVVFPELTLSGYPPEDLLFHRGLRRQVEAGLLRVCGDVGSTAVLFGYPEYSGTDIYNSGGYIADGKLSAIHRKAELPNYKVFDEKRYFRQGSLATVIEHKGFRIGTQQSAVLDFMLEVGAVSEQITVVGEAPLVERASATQATSLDKEALQSLPIFGRNTFFAAISTAGVIQTGDPQFVRYQDQSGSSQLSLGGGPRRGNGYLIEGV